MKHSEIKVYTDLLSEITTLPVSQFEIGQLPVTQVGWIHNVILMQKVAVRKFRTTTQHGADDINRLGQTK